MKITNFASLTMDLFDRKRCKSLCIFPSIINVDFVHHLILYSIKYEKFAYRNSVYLSKYAMSVVSPSKIFLLYDIFFYYFVRYVGLEIISNFICFFYETKICFSSSRFILYLSQFLNISGSDTL